MYRQLIRYDAYQIEIHNLFCSKVIHSMVARQHNVINIVEFNLGERFPFDSKINGIRAL